MKDTSTDQNEDIVAPQAAGFGKNAKMDSDFEVVAGLDIHAVDGVFNITRHRKALSRPPDGLDALAVSDNGWTKEKWCFWRLNQLKNRSKFWRKENKELSCVDFPWRAFEEFRTSCARRSFTPRSILVLLQNQHSLDLAGVFNAPGNLGILFPCQLVGEDYLDGQEHRSCGASCCIWRLGCC